MKEFEALLLLNNQATDKPKDKALRIVLTMAWKYLSKKREWQTVLDNMSLEEYALEENAKEMFSIK